MRIRQKSDRGCTRTELSGTRPYLIVGGDPVHNGFWPITAIDSQYSSPNLGSSSDITDDPTVTPSYTAKYCQHIRRSMNVLDCNWNVTDYNHENGGNVRIITTVRPPLAKTAFQPADWDAMCLALEDAVNRRLKARGLIAVSLMELRKTVKMIRNPFSLLQPKTWKAMTMPARHYHKILPNFWLEYQYGWRPLLQDITTFSEVLGGYMGLPSTNVLKEDPETSFSIKGSSRSYSRAPTVSDSTFRGRMSSQNVTKHPEGGYWRYVFEDCRTVPYLSALCDEPVRVGHKRVTDLLNQLGVSPRDLADVLWEIVPFSFVADWFINSNKVLHYFDYQRARSFMSANCRNLCYTQKNVEMGHAEFIPTLNYSQIGGYNGGTAYFAGSNVQFRSGQMFSSKYTRNIGLPPGTSLIKGRWLTATQSTSALSLILQQVNRHLG